MINTNNNIDIEGAVHSGKAAGMLPNSGSRVNINRLADASAALYEAMKIILTSVATVENVKRTNGVLAPELGSVLKVGNNLIQKICSVSDAPKQSATLQS